MKKQSYKTEYSHFFLHVFMIFKHMSDYPLYVNNYYLQSQVLCIKCHVFTMKCGQNAVLYFLQRCVSFYQCFFHGTSCPCAVTRGTTTFRTATLKVS